MDYIVSCVLCGEKGTFTLGYTNRFTEHVAKIRGRLLTYQLATAKLPGLIVMCPSCKNSFAGREELSTEHSRIEEVEKNFIQWKKEREGQK